MNTSTSFDWNLLRSFLAVLDHHTLVKAAQALDLSQPTLGRHISELEQQLGTVLFERTGRRLLPTAQALQLSETVRQMEGSAASIYRIIKSKSTDLNGRVRITASQPVACILLPPVLARMKQALPDIDIDLVSSNSISNLLRREADIALRMVRPDQSSLITKRIAEVQIVTCAHQGYLKAHGRPSSVPELRQHQLIGSENNSDMERHAKSLGHDSRTFNYSLRTDDYIAQWAAIQAGLGIGFTADYVAAGNAKVQTLLPDLNLPSLPIWLTVHREIRNSGPIRAVFDFLAKEVPAELKKSQ